MIYGNATEFYGRPVKDWTEAGADAFDYVRHAPRLRLDYDEAQDEGTIKARLLALLERPEARAMTGLVFGMWGDGETSSSVVVETLVDGKAKLPALEALFIGDIVSEENEISWIQQSDVSPLWAAFPDLRMVRLRGGSELSVGRIALARLETLIIETGGLPKAVVDEVFGSPLPSLKHLELYLGSDNYGGTSSVVQFENLALSTMPALRSLGLRDCEFADKLAQAIATAPVVTRIERLDLSLGTLGDEGAKALLASPAVARLRELDLHHHYIGDEVAARLRALGPKVNLDDKQKEEEYGRYIAVSE